MALTRLNSLSIPPNTIVAADIDDDSITTAKIANDQVTGAKLNPSLVAGDIIYADGTDTITRLAKGTAAQVLAINSGATAPEWADAGGGAYSAWLVKDADGYDALDGDQIICKKATAFTIDLPSGTDVGRSVTFHNAGAGTVTIGRNSQPINSTAADGELTTGNSTQLVYVDATIGWKEI